MATLLFIDTNIWLDFYRSNNEAGLSLLRHVKEKSEFIIVTDQIKMEFLKNRQNEIVQSFTRLTSPGRVSIPAFLTSKEVDDLDDAYTTANNLIKRIKQRIPLILEDPEVHDEVYKTCHEVFNKKDKLHFGQTHEAWTEVREAARERYSLGYPPRKATDTSMGDAVNWEWIVYCARITKSNVAIVSRDYDYGQSHKNKSYIDDYLKHEFSERVGNKRRVTLFTRLTEVLKQYKVTVTKKEEHEEARLAQTARASRLSDIYAAYYNQLAETPLALAEAFRQVAKQKGEQQAAIEAAIKPILPTFPEGDGLAD